MFEWELYNFPHKISHGIMFCNHRMVLFTAFNALLSVFSLNSLFWVGLF